MRHFRRKRHFRHKNPFWFPAKVLVGEKLTSPKMFGEFPIDLALPFSLYTV